MKIDDDDCVKCVLYSSALDASRVVSHVDLTCRNAQNSFSI